MIDYETYRRIKQYQQEGLKAGQIAQKLDLDTRTVESWLDESQYRQRKQSESSSKLDPYKDDIVSLLEKHPYTATQIYQRLQEDGYEGSYSLVKQYVRKVRPKRKPAFLTLAFAPGESAQVDWGIYKTIEVGATRRKLNFFVRVQPTLRAIFKQPLTVGTHHHSLLQTFSLYQGELSVAPVEY